jgi:hypothetical protein
LGKEVTDTLVYLLGSDGVSGCLKPHEQHAHGVIESDYLELVIGEERAA